MKQSFNAALVLFLTALFPAPVHAQEQLLPTASGPTAAGKPDLVESSVSLGTAAQLTATRQTYGMVQALDPTATVLGTFRQSFRPWLGYTTNVGYTRTPEENAGLGGFSPSHTLRIPTNVYELSVAYLLQQHLTPKLTGFADLGGGVLTFLPVRGGSDAANLPGGRAQVLFRQLGVAGVGVDYRFSSCLALRAEYRGLLYKFSDFQGTVGRAITVTSQPTLSLTYTFGHKRKDRGPTSASQR